VRQLLRTRRACSPSLSRGPQPCGDPDRLADVLARQQPAWSGHAPGLSRHHPWLLRERAAAPHRPPASQPGQFFQDEIAAPLDSTSTSACPNPFRIPGCGAGEARPVRDAARFGIRFFLTAFNRRSNIARALEGSMFPHDEQRVYARNFEIPSGGGVGTARAIAMPTACSRLTERSCSCARKRCACSRRWRFRSTGFLRRVHDDRRCAVLAGLHEALPVWSFAAMDRSASPERAARWALRSKTALAMPMSPARWARRLRGPA